jgi:hypothetical protein
MKQYPVAFDSMLIRTRSSPSIPSPDDEQDDDHMTLRKAPYGLEPLLTYVGVFLKWPLEFSKHDNCFKTKLRNGDEATLSPLGVKGNTYAFNVEYHPRVVSSWTVCPQGIVRPRQDILPHVLRNDGRTLHQFLKARVV